MLKEISGTFVKIAFKSDFEIHLKRGHSHRPAARFNQVGQDALYLSPDEKSARVAIGEYVNLNDLQRVLITYEVEKCKLFDLRDDDASDIYELARQPWRKALKAGLKPASWEAANILRTTGQVGLIDPSRQQPGLWHITLFRWNEDNAPSVRQVSKPVPIYIEPKDC